MQHEDYQKRLFSEVRQLKPAGFQVELKEMEKNNGVRVPAICIRQEKESISPSISLVPYLEEAGRGVSCRHLARQIWDCYEEARVKGAMPERFFSSYNDVRARVFCRLVNYEKNRDQLLSVPHEMWQDLAVTYYYQVDPAILPDATILIRHEHLKKWQVEEEELRRDAWKNSLAKMPLQFLNLGAVLQEMAVWESEGAGEETNLALLTNESRTLGAVCICYPGATEEISKAVSGDYYILPSSIHECLILPDDGSFEREELERVVRQINRTQLSPQEILSDRVYHYSAKTSAVH